MEHHVDAALDQALTALNRLREDHQARANIVDAAKRISQAFKAGGRLFSCGNGGSMCDAMHLAEELTGKFRDDRAPLPAMAISDAGFLSCAANDYGYDLVFERWIEAHGRKGDVLVAISTSGTSKNVVKAAQAARKKGLTVVALTGKDGSTLGNAADLSIVTRGEKYADRVQELHIKVIHILIELIEKEMFGGGK